MKTLTAKDSVTPQATKSLGRRWWIVAVPLMVIILIAQMDKVVIAIFMSNKQFLTDLHLLGKPALIGMLMSSFLITYAVFQFLWGWIVKRFGPRNSAIVGIIIWGGVMVLSGLARSAGDMILARTILGVGEAFMFPVANTFVANWFPVRERARASAVWFNGIQIGPAVAGALAAIIIVAVGWRISFFFLGGLSLVISLPLVIFLMRDNPRKQRLVSSGEVNLIEEGSWAKTKEVPKTEGKQGYLTNRYFWVVTIAWGFNNVFFWGWASWMPTYFQTARHFSFRSAGYIYSLAFLACLCTNMLAGYFSDKRMKRAPLASFCWIGAGVLFLVGGLLMENPYWALVWLVIAQCVNTPAVMLAQAIMHSVVPEQRIPAAIGVGGGVSQLMGAVSPTVIGFLVGASGFGGVIVFLAFASIIPGFLAIYLARKGY